MKKVVFMLLAGVLTLSAVEWDIQQVTYTVDVDNYEPILVLDNAGKARILYGEWGETEEVTLTVASNATGSWQFEDVAITSGLGGSWSHGLDVDTEGYTYVAYVDLVSPIITDLYFSTNKGGSFSSINVTDNAFFQFAPVLKLDRSGIPHIAFVQSEDAESEIQLWQGWVAAEGFESEQVTQNLYQDAWLGHDLVFDQLNQPNIFYIGDDSYLWQTAPGEVVAWEPQKLNELSSEWPSAAADPVGPLHVAYDVGEESIHYMSNIEGPWQDELVSDNIPPGGGVWRPSLALDNIYGYHALGSPHIIWNRYDADAWGDLWYASKPEGAWLEEPVTSEPDKDEWPGFGHYFAIDRENYGHIVYDFPDTNEIWQIMYAKSTEPIAEPVAVAEDPVLVPLLEVKSSAVHFTLVHPSSVSINLFDAAGRQVSNIASGNYSSGQHTTDLNVTTLPTGMYFVRLVTGEFQTSTRFIHIE